VSYRCAVSEHDVSTLIIHGNVQDEGFAVDVASGGLEPVQIGDRRMSRLRVPLKQSTVGLGGTRQTPAAPACNARKHTTAGW
jgi:hypothetical protein